MEDFILGVVAVTCLALLLALCAAVWVGLVCGVLYLLGII